MLNLVAPHLEYWCVVWMECGKLLWQWVERIQNYTNWMLLICSKSPRTCRGLWDQLNWMPLARRHEFFRFTLMQCCVHQKVPDYLLNFIKTNEKCGCHVKCEFRKLHNRKIWTEFGQKATAVKGGLEWNTLPERFRYIKNSQASVKEHTLVI